MVTERKRVQVVICLAQPKDAASINSVLHKAFLEYRPQYTEAAFAATVPSSAEIVRRMEEGPVWVARDGTVTVGTIAAVKRNQSLYIRGMAIIPEARGKGIGGILLKGVERYGLEQEIGRLFLSTTPFLSRAIRLYESYGFCKCAHGPHDLFGTPLFTMEKLLER